MNILKRFTSLIHSQIISVLPKKLKFPSISQIIPEAVRKSLFSSPIFLTAFACGFLFMAIMLMGNDLKNNIDSMQMINKERTTIESQIIKWKGVTSRFKTYKDGYYMLSILEYRLGNFDKSYDYARKALSIDPNYKEALDLLAKIAAE